MRRPNKIEEEIIKQIKKNREIYSKKIRIINDYKNHPH